MPKVVQIVTVKNPFGLHARPATAIAKLLQNTSSQVFFTCGKETVNAKSVLCILMLGACQHTEIEVTVEGEDAEKIMGEIAGAFDRCFGEV
ncbi:MAG: Phosphocarrier protein HPr [Chlamydiota bacterium]|jgi:phosphocarrier protein